jgi:hypothetical protein
MCSSRRDFFGNREGRLVRVYRFGDGPADDKIVRAGPNCLRRGCHTRLIIHRSTRRAYAGYDNQEFRAARTTNGANLSRRGDNAIEPRFLRKTRQCKSAGSW